MKGKISPETYEEWNRETGSAELPDHVKPSTKSRKKRAKPRTGTKLRRKAARKPKKKAVRRSE
jgi:hypothetical protein